jgi:hypothetical protein
MRELYIYYRVRESAAAAARRDVAALQAALRAAHPGLEARLLHRPESSAGLQTWMEIYARPAQPGGVSVEVQADIEARAAQHATHLEGTRHVEVFVGVDT